MALVGLVLQTNRSVDKFYIDVRDFDIYLQKTTSKARKVIALDFSGNKQTYGIDIRDSAINWINDIEKGSNYKNWPSSVSELLRPTFPGMLRSIRYNS